MSDISYNHALLEFSNAGLAALAQSAANSTTAKTPAAESHFLCSWMATALKKRTFSKLIADDLSFWIRQARSMGAAAELKLLLQKINVQYSYIADKQHGLAANLNAMLTQLAAEDWLIITDQEVTKKLKLNSDGQASLIISDEQFEQCIDGDELVRPITLYSRAPEATLSARAYQHDLLISAGNKKASLIKHHKAYQIWPENLQPALALLQPLP